MQECLPVSEKLLTLLIFPFYFFHANERIFRPYVPVVNDAVSEERCNEVESLVFDLFANLGATGEAI